MEHIIVTHQETKQTLKFNPGQNGKVVREEVFGDWGRGHITSATNIRITDVDVDLPAGDYSFRPAAQPGAAPPGATGVQAGWFAAGNINLNELMKPEQEVYVLKFKVHNTLRRTRLTLKVIMEQHGVRGRIRRESRTIVSATAIVGIGEEDQAARFIRSLRAFVKISETAINDRPYIMAPTLWERVDLKQHPLIDEMCQKGVQVDKMSQATKRSYVDPSQASSDPDGAVSTVSSLSNAARSIDIPN